MTTGREEALGRTEREIAAEKAAALGRAGERLEAALSETAAIGARLAAAADADVRATLERAYEAARQRALAARLALVIQREALGFRGHRILDQQFPEPPRRPGPRPGRT